MKTFFLLIMLTVTNFAIASGNPSEPRIKINRAMVITAGFFGINMLPQNRVVEYIGKSLSGQECGILANLVVADKTLYGVRIKMGIKNAKDLVSVDLALSNSVVAETRKVNGLFFLETTFRSDRSTSLDKMGIMASNSNGNFTVTLSENSKALTCTGFKIKSQPVE
jgi:hypothetical protein